ncbi:hypothetical protein ILUMI_23213 [Ignelater luminosus]|uniref:Uncharacterized protein n=1 Tax=Ignelater luminosus TaxID=2038154 RepID=A0A8K0CFR2_IGNLU|nr:hypothetical protein ILUMI_23213 [Ignelater luminosus]
MRLFTLVEQIPSDNESIVSDSEDESERNFDMPMLENPENNAVCNNTDWDSKDDLPLASFLLAPPAEMTANMGRCLSLKEFRLVIANGLIGADPEIPQRDRKSTEKI